MAKNERKLTPAEQKRKEQFALVCEEMERQGYRKIDLTIGVVKANLLALIVMLPFAVLSGAVVLSSYSLRSMIESPITSLVLLFYFPHCFCLPQSMKASTPLHGQCLPKIIGNPSASA